MQRDRHLRGSSIVEVIVAGLILALSTLYLASTYRVHLAHLGNTMSRETALEAEDGIRRDLFAIVQAYYKAATPACSTGTLNFASRLATTFTSGITSTPVTSANADAIRALTIQSSAKNEVEVVIQRCLRAPDTNAAPSYFKTRAGIYFCAQFTAPPASPSALTSMQPVIGEFFYTNRNGLTGAEILCPNLKALLSAVPPKPTMGVLIYTIHWLPKPGTMVRSVTGMISEGNS